MRAQFAVLLASRISAAGLQAVTGVLLARAVQPHEYGVLMGAMGGMFLWFVMCDLGLTTYIARERAAGKQAVVASALHLNARSSAWGGVAAAIFVGLVFWVTDPSLVAPLIVLAAALALEKNVDTSLSVPIADQNKLVPTLSILGRRGVSAVVFVLLLWFHADPFFAYSSSYLLGVFGAWILARCDLRARGALSSRRARITPRQLVRRAWPFFVTNLSVQSRSLDVLLVSLVSSPTDAGLFAAASKLVSPILLIPSTVTTLVLPYMVREGKSRHRVVAWKLCAAAAAMLVVCALLAFFSPWIVTFVLGGGYSQAAAIMAALILGLPFIALSSPLASVLQGIGAERFVARNSVVFAMLTLCAIAGGGLVLGGLGAAGGVGVAFLLKCVVLQARIVRRPES